MSAFLIASNSKRFKKQTFEKAKPHEIIKDSDLEDFIPDVPEEFRMESVCMINDRRPVPAPLHNDGLTSTRHIWFDPMLDPKIVNLKKPEKSSFGDVAFTLFAAHHENKTYSLLPLQHMVIRTGFALRSGLLENWSCFGDYPNWYATLHALQKTERAGVHIGTSIIRPHDHREIKVTLFNFGRDVVQIKPQDPVAELLFAACHTPDIAQCHRNLICCYDGEFHIKQNIYSLKNYEYTYLFILFSDAEYHRSLKASVCGEETD